MMLEAASIKNKEIFMAEKVLLSLKTQKYDQRVGPASNNDIFWMSNVVPRSGTNPKIKKVTKSYGEMMLNINIKIMVSCEDNRNQTGFKVILDFTANKRQWSSHVARMNDNRRTKRISSWQSRNGGRSTGRQTRRWRDDISSTEVLVEQRSKTIREMENRM